MPLEDKNILIAIEEMKKKSKHRNFTQTVELIINLRDVDVKKQENRIQERVILPHPFKKNRKICVIASGEAALSAKRGEADLVLTRSDLESLMGDKKKRKQIAKDFEVFIAEAPLMPLVGRSLGAALGPLGKMPTPVPPNVDMKGQIERHRRMVTVRTRNQPVLRCGVANEEMPDEEIMENVQAVFNAVERRVQRGFRNIRSVYLKMTMGEPVQIKL